MNPEDSLGDNLGLENGTVDLIFLSDGRAMSTHGPSVCRGERCCIHNPSAHPLNTAPMRWMDEMRLMFRVCRHGAIHPDPDALGFHQLLAFAGVRTPYDGWHPCCDAICCATPEDTE